MSRSHGRNLIFGALFATTAMGCSAQVVDRPSGGVAPSGVPTSPTGTGGAPNAGSGPVTSGSGGLSAVGGSGPGAVACSASPPQLITRVGRLTHSQYDNSVQQLLGTSSSFANTYQPDPSFGSFNNAVNDLRVVDRLGRDYRGAAETLAAAAAGDAAFRARTPECQTANTATCGAAFVKAFGLQAFRRPLTTAEEGRFAAAFQAAGALLPGADPIADGIQLVVEAMLQSPKFLYRVEVSELSASVDKSLPLDDYELATRLSYLIWNSTPDPALLAAAAVSSLTRGEGVTEQANRMVADPRTRNTVVDFHRQWLGADRFSNASADPKVFPKFTPAVIQGLSTELGLFIGDLFDQQRAATDILTASFSYVDANLAAIYGLPGTFGDRFQRVELEPSQRSGLFTQLGFLASHAHATATSPIHRGVSILRDVLCVTVPPPPGNVDLTFPAFDANIRTTRDQVKVHTSKAECAGCHAEVINPVGFAFENYDPTGAYRAIERDTPVDATGQITLDGKPVAFKNGVELLHSIAASAQGRSCYAQKWMQYGYARAPVASDACTADQLAQSLTGSAYSFQRILLDLAATPSFLRRAAD